MAKSGASGTAPASALIVTTSRPQYERAVKTVATLPGAVLKGITSMIGLPRSESGRLGPGRYVTNVLTRRWWLMSGRSTPR